MGRRKYDKGSSSIVGEPLLIEDTCLENSKSLPVIETRNEAKNNPHSYAFTTKRRRREKNATPIRRSKRIGDSSLHRSENLVEVGILQIKDVNDEEQEEDERNSDIPPDQRAGTDQDPCSNGGRREFDEKLEYLVKAVKEFKAEIFGEQNGGPSSYNYKVMYMEEQKKIDALVATNSELAKKLQFASGKVEAFQTMSHAIFGSAEKLKVVPGGVRTADTRAKSPLGWRNHDIPADNDTKTKRKPRKM